MRCNGGDWCWSSHARLDNVSIRDNGYAKYKTITRRTIIAATASTLRYSASILRKTIGNESQPEEGTCD